jgi:hypothetical protein
MLAFTLVMQVAIRPFGEPDTSPPAASVVLMEEAEVRQRATLEKKEAPLAVSPSDMIAPPAAPPGRVAEDAAVEQLRDEFVPAEMQPGRAGLEAQVPVAPSLNAPEPGVFAGAPLKAGEPAAIDEARLADAVELIRASRVAEADEEAPRHSDTLRRAKSGDADGVASEAGEATDAEPPQAWLDEVLRLYDAGDFDGAMQRLDGFRAAYPQHPVSLRLADTLD